MSAKVKLSPYWACQLLGWGTVAPYWLYYEVQNKSIAEGVAVVVFQVLLQIWVTHRYRWLMHRQGWLRQPLPQQLPRILVAWLVLIAQYLAMVYVTYSIQFTGNFWADNVWLGALAGGTRYHAIWLLGFHLYHFSRQSADQAAAAARSSQLVTEAQLARLSNDINPHFLFNALNGIKALTREDPARSREAIDRLSALLRYSLMRSSQARVPLGDEITIIKEYLALEKIRFEERLTVAWDLPGDYADCELPPLSLHTLVDNALKHGIALLPEGGTVKISLRKTSSDWIFTVRNPCSSKTQPGTRVSAQKNTGTGIPNLQQRLKLQYGNNAHLTYQRANSYTVATLTIPS